MLNGALGLGFTLTAKDLASSVFQNVGRNLNRLQVDASHTTGNWVDANGRLQDSFGRFAKGATKSTKEAGGAFSRLASKALGFLGAGAISFKEVIGVANEFTSALNNLKGVSGATDEQMVKLRRAALDAGIATQFSPGEAAAALTDIVAAGSSVDDSMKLLLPTLDLAAASFGKLGPDKAARLVQEGLHAFHLGMDQAGTTVDKFVRSQSLLGIHMDELPLGLANASRGAEALHQGLDETLITFGLMHKVMPRVASAGTAAAVAMEKMGGANVQAALKQMGVQVADAHGKFRPFLDIVTEMGPALSKMTEKDRTQKLTKLFGDRAAGGITAILGQLSTGVKDASGHLLKGADAVAYLRDQMHNAKGAAAQLRDALLSDLPGQLKLLRGSALALATVIGEPIAQALAPLVGHIIDVVNAAIGFFDSLSAGAKKSMAQIALAIGAFGTALATVGPEIAIPLALIAGLFYGIKYAYDHNLGGIGDKFRAWADDVNLVWDGLSQVFSQGGFSGSVRKELNKAENAGLKNFVITVFVWVERLKHLFEGIEEGFSKGMSKIGPTIDKLEESFSRLAEALGLTTKNDPSENRDKWDAWGKTGEKVGTAFANAIADVATAIADVMDFASSFLDVFEGFGPIWDAASSAGDALGDALSNLAAALGITSSSADDNLSGFEKFGIVLATVVNEAVDVLAAGIKAVSGTIDGLSEGVLGLSDIFRGVFSGDISQVMQGFEELILGIVKAVVNALSGMVKMVASAIDAFGRMAHVNVGAEKAIGGMMTAIDMELDKSIRSVNSDRKKDSDSGEEDKDSFFYKYRQAKSESQTRRFTDHIANSFDNFGSNAVGSALSGINSFFGPGRGGGGAPVQVKTQHTSTTNLVVDGQTLATVIKKYMHEENVRAGADAPAPGG